MRIAGANVEKYSASAVTMRIAGANAEDDSARRTQQREPSEPAPDADPAGAASTRP